MYLDTRDENECNWLTLISPAEDVSEQNCIAFQLGNDIYYSTIRKVKVGEAMKVWYAPGYARKIQKPEKPPGCNMETSGEAATEMVEGKHFYSLCLS